MVQSAVGVTHTQARVVALTGNFFTPDWLFYSNQAPVTVTPGTTYAVEISGASLFVDALGLDIDLSGVIAGTTNAIQVQYMRPQGSSFGFGGTVTATQVPPTAGTGTTPVPIPAGLPLIVTGLAAIGLLRRS